MYSTCGRFEVKKSPEVTLCGWLTIYPIEININKLRCRPKLPEYLLDFGYVVLGTQRTHVVRATNTGWCPVSFKMERGAIHSLGFIVELDRVRNLPGAPDNETVDFVVTFDPRAANLQLGPVEAVVPIHVSRWGGRGLERGGVEGVWGKIEN